MMLPLNFPVSVLKQYNEIVRDYLWNWKKPRISLTKLFTTTERGGLALPNIELYNIAFERVKLCKHWSGSGSHLGWMEIEKLLTSCFRCIDALSQKPSQSPYEGGINRVHFNTHVRFGTKSIKRLACLNINKVTHLYEKIL